MNVRSFAEVAEFFLRDIFAFLVPGAVLLIALSLVFGRTLSDALGGTLTIPPEGADQWTIAVVLSYIAGASMQAAGERIVVAVINRLGEFAIKRCKTQWRIGDIESQSSFNQRTTGSRSFLTLRAMLRDHLHFDVEADLHKVRNLAMSIAPSRISEVYRNMYTSQLCLGSSVALLTTSIITLGSIGLNQFTSVGPETRSFGSAWLVVFLPMAVLLLDRRYRYYSISMRIPIDIALAYLSEGATNSRGAVAMKTHLVYLAGGMRGTWQDEVKAACLKLEFSDPRNHALTEPRDFTAWDLEHIRQSDVLLGYMSEDNPSGVGLALELGYAKALGKLTILVDEKSAGDKEFARYFSIVAAAVDVRKSSLAEGITFLQSLER